MSLLNQANNIATTLSGNGGSITSGATSLKVASSTGFPAVPFTAIITHELVLVTNVSSLTWTVTRGSESTPAAAHNDGDEVRHVSTAAWANSLPQLQTGTPTTQTGLLSIDGSGNSQHALGVSNDAASKGAVFGATTAANGYGVYGLNLGSAGSGYAVYGSGGSNIGGNFTNTSPSLAALSATNTSTGPGLAIHPYYTNNSTAYTNDTWANRPGSPTTGDIHYATDRHIEYYYDGTRWLSTTLYYLQFDANSATIPLTTTLNAAYLVQRPDKTNDIYCIEYCYWFRQAATFDATHNWTGQLINRDSSGTNNNLGSSFNTWVAARTAATDYFDTVTLNTALTVANSWRFAVNWTINGAGTGSLTLVPSLMSYRLIG